MLDLEARVACERLLVTSRRSCVWTSQQCHRQYGASNFAITCLVTSSLSIDSESSNIRGIMRIENRNDPLITAELWFALHCDESVLLSFACQVRIDSQFDRQRE